MGLFNFNFGGSKKGQNQPIRDKIKNRKPVGGINLS